MAVKHFQQPQQKPKPAATAPKPEPTMSDEEFSKLAQARGYKLVDREEYRKQVGEDTEIAQALKDLTGLDLADAQQQQIPIGDLVDQTDIIDRMAKQIDLLASSTQWASLISPKQKLILHAVRVFIRQLRSEVPPPGQYGTIKDLLALPNQVPPGILATRGTPGRRIKVTQRHLELAGIVQSRVAQESEV